MRPVHEGQAEREQRAQAAEQRALHDDPRGRCPQQLHEEQEERRAHDAREHSAPSISTVDRKIPSMGRREP